MDQSNPDISQRVWVEWARSPFFAVKLSLGALWVESNFISMVFMMVKIEDVSREGWEIDIGSVIDKRGSH